MFAASWRINVFAAYNSLIKDVRKSAIFDPPFLSSSDQSHAPLQT